MPLNLSNVGGTYWASAVFDTKDDVGIQPVLTNAFGVVSVTRADNAAYDITLVNELSPNECIGLAFNIGTGDPLLVTLVHISNKVKRMFVYDRNGTLNLGLLSVSFFQLAKSSDVVEYYVAPPGGGD
jgi:hypothetical protein